MSDRFKTENGMIQFVFANEDKYYTDSMMRLNLSEKLYYDLKNKDYTTVCFIKLIGDAYHVDFADQKVLDAYMTCEKRGISIFGKKKTNADEQALYRNVDLSRKKEFVNQLFKMMKRENSRIAYVFDVDAFDTLKEYVGDLEEIKDKNYKYKNLILIKSPVEVEGTVRVISKNDSIYRTNLFSEICDIFKNYKNVHLFEKMQELMPDRIAYMNKLEEKQLENMIRHVIFEGCTRIDEKLALVEDYATCLWYLYHSSKFRNWAKTECSYLEQQFPQNPLNLYQVIEEIMRKDSSYQVLEKLIIKIQQLSSNSSVRLKYNIKDVLQIDDCDDEHQIYLHMANPLCGRVMRLSCDFVQNEDMKKNMIKQKKEIQKKILTVCVNQNSKFEEEKMAYVDSYLDNAGAAQANKDTQRFKYALEALYYTFCQCNVQTRMENNENEKEKLERIKCLLDCYKYILSNQDFLFSYKSKLSEDYKELEELQKQYDGYAESIEDMTNNVPDILSRVRRYLSSEEVRERTLPQWSRFYEEYLKQAKRMADLAPVIKMKKDDIRSKEQKILSVQKNIDNMNINRAHMDSVHVGTLRREMELSIKLMGPLFEKIQKEFSEHKPIDLIKVEGVTETYEETLKALDRLQVVDGITNEETNDELLGIEDLFDNIN